MPFTLNQRRPLISESLRYTKSLTSNIRSLLLLSAKLFCQVYATLRFSRIICTCFSAFLKTSGSNSWLSPVSFQNRGVLHSFHREPQMGTFLGWPNSYCNRKTPHTIGSYLSFCSTSKHKLSIYLQISTALAGFEAKPGETIATGFEEETSKPRC